MRVLANAAEAISAAPVGSVAVRRTLESGFHAVVNAVLRWLHLRLQETQISRPQIALAPAAGLFDIERRRSHPWGLRLTRDTIPIQFCCRMSMTYDVGLSDWRCVAQLCVMAHARTIKQKHSGSWSHVGFGAVLQSSRWDRGKCRQSATKFRSEKVGLRVGWWRAITPKPSCMN